jgi:hypothetical protein
VVQLGIVVVVLAMAWRILRRTFNA